MDQSQINAKIDAYLDQHWDDIVADIDTLVRIPSVEELDKAEKGAPYGPGPRAALTAALEMADRMGFEPHDEQGHIGYADFPGKTEGQIGIIGHTDVVPAGPGWNFEPYQVTRKDGYLIGRGVIDDKGPSVVALHAMKFWKDLQDEGAAERFPYTLRFLFGANEETGMADVTYYRQRHADPLFLFTPDAEFPVSYGEKGLYDGSIHMPASSDGRIVEFEGGAATNAVPGLAHAVVRANAADLPAENRLTISDAGDGCARIDAEGKSAHASTPEQGVSAIGLIVDYLLENGICNEAERSFLELEQRIASHADGSGVGLACEDEHFGPLTLVGGTIATRDGAFVQSIDIRFPTSITAEQITATMEKEAQAIGATYGVGRQEKPFLMDPSSPMIQALLAAYNEATGEQGEVFTQGGGTYARHFSNAASFGPEKSWVKVPEWVGGMHGPDEGASEELLREAFRIYALTIGRLMELEF
ncbi:MAG: Sapep family Mn(2+)-dependent dipeptidase [Eggerthellaceae bacterium]|nr:Sapep family Mn(2+)-dependent dipeptidase [Eggerthellaceae bacterium]